MESCNNTSLSSGHKNFLVLQHLWSCSTQPNIINHCYNPVAFTFKLLSQRPHKDAQITHNPDFHLQSALEPLQVLQTHTDDVPCCVVAVRLIVLLGRVRLLQSLQFQLWGQEGAQVGDGAGLRCDHCTQNNGTAEQTWKLSPVSGNCCLPSEDLQFRLLQCQIYGGVGKRRRRLTREGGDVVFEQAVRLPSFGHEASERTLHVPPLAGGFLPQHLVVRHGLPERLAAEG